MRRRHVLSSSAYLAALLVVVHALALAALAAVLPAWAAVAAGGLILVSLLHYLLRDAWLRLGASCVALAMDEEGLEIFLRDGTRLPGVVLKDSVVTPALVVLNIRPPDSQSTRSVVILPDSLDAESFRELRVWLRWGDHPTQGDAPVRRNDQAGDARE